MLMIDVLRIILVGTGILLFGLTLSSLARRKMTESFCLTWGLVALIMIISGIVLQPYGLGAMISASGLVIIVVVGYCLIFGAFYITGKVSEVERKSRELAIQVSLLNQENRMIMDKLEELTAETEAE